MFHYIRMNICTLAIVAAASQPVLAANSVDVRVIGAITPAACTPTLSGGGAIDYGIIRPNELSATEYTLLSEKQIDFSILCDAPAKVAVYAINGRPGTMAGSEDGPEGGTKPFSFPGFFGSDSPGAGLGLDGTTRIGGYGIRLAQGTFTADGNAVDVISKFPNYSNWLKTTKGTLYSPSIPGRSYVSWAAAGTLVPVAFEVLTGKLGVHPYINMTSELDMSKPINLDGLTTLELFYL